MTFRPITETTKLTFPCLVARQTVPGFDPGDEWSARIAYESTVERHVRDNYTHWLPFQWPKGSSWTK